MSKRWIINPTPVQVTAHNSSLVEDKFALLDWVSNRQSVDVTVARYAAGSDRLIITVEGLGSVSLEYERGDIRVHCYAHDKEEPVSVRFNHDDVEVDT